MRIAPKLTLASCACVVLATAFAPTPGRTAAQTKLSPEASISRARELLRAGRSESALAVLQNATRGKPKSDELELLQGIASLGLAAEIVTGFDTASTKLDLARGALHAAEKEGEPFGPAALAVLKSSFDHARRAYEAAAARAEKVAGLFEAAERASSARASADPEAIRLYAWTEAFRLLASEGSRLRTGVFDRITGERGADTAALGLPRGLDRTALEGRVKAAAARYSRSHPQDPLPFLLIAEWIQLADWQAVLAQGSGATLGRQLYANGVRNGKTDELTQRALREYEQWRDLPVETLEKVGVSHVLALLRKAEKLDTAGKYSLAYELYTQVAPVDRAEADRLLDKLAKASGTGPLVALERARRALTENADLASALKLVQQARRGTLHRPLFVTMPDEIRRSLVWSSMMWPQQRPRFGSSFDYAILEQRVRLASRSQTQPQAKQRIRFLAVGLGQLLRSSDLPCDWVVGSRLHGDAALALSRDESLPPDQRALLRIEHDRTETEARSSPLPVMMAMYHAGRFTYLHHGEPEGDENITAPFLSVIPEGLISVARGDGRGARK